MRARMMAVGLMAAALTPPVAVAKRPAGDKPRTVTYAGSGTVADIDLADGTLTVNFSHVNRSLAQLLGGRREMVPVRVAARTRMTVDGLDAGLDELCPGDHVTVRLRNGRRARPTLTAAVSRVAASAVAADCADDELMLDQLAGL